MAGRETPGPVPKDEHVVRKDSSGIFSEDLRSSRNGGVLALNEPPTSFYKMSYSKLGILNGNQRLPSRTMFH